MSDRELRRLEVLATLPHSGRQSGSAPAAIPRRSCTIIVTFDAVKPKETWMAGTGPAMTIPSGLFEA